MIFIANSVGMSLSTAILLIISTHIYTELSFDKFQTKADRIVRIHHGFGAITPPAYGPFFNDESADVVSYLRTLKFDAQLNSVDANGNYNMFKTDVFFVDSTWHRFFEMQPILGNAETCLEQPNSIVLNASTAQRIFGDKNPIGEILIGENIELEVTAVIEDYPYESVFDFDVLANVKVLEQLWGWKDMFNSFGSNNFETYLLLNKDVNSESLASVLDKRIRKRLSSLYPDEDFSNYAQIELLPFRDTHFDTTKYSRLKTANKKKITIYALLALFILLITIVNYINIATVRSFEFAKSMAVKKSFGAKRLALGLEIISEAILTVFVSLIIGFFISKFLASYFSEVIGKPVSIDFSVITLLLIFIGVPLLIGFISGFYPAIVLSRINALPQNNKVSKTALRVRQSLSLLQFSGTLIVTIAILVIHLQNTLILNYDTGVRKDNILQVSGNNQALKKFDVFKAKLTDIESVQSVCFSKNNPVKVGEFSSMRFKGEDENIFFKVIYASPEVFNTFDIKVKEGRVFKPEERSGVCLINETAASKINNKAPLESHIQSNKDIEIIGVLEDFNIASLHDEILPLIVYPVRNNWGNYYIHLNGNHAEETIVAIQQAFNEVFPDKLFEYDFIDDIYNNMYKQEIEFQKLMPILSFFAIIISCLGLFILTVFAVQKRTKEIAIRKVNGAKSLRLVLNMNKSTIKLVVVAFAVASPIAWFTMNKWLEGFAYKIELDWWIFALAGLFTLCIALLTVSWQSFKAATRNPVEALRYE
jgi:putative ABC transport system permease protein